jgi:hypothetical protein
VATPRGAFLNLFRTCTSAPFCMSVSTTAAWPLAAALCSGVLPVASTSLAEYPSCCGGYDGYMLDGYMLDTLKFLFCNAAAQDCVTQNRLMHLCMPSVYCCCGSSHCNATAAITSATATSLLLLLVLLVQIQVTTTTAALVIHLLLLLL